MRDEQSRLESVSRWYSSEYGSSFFARLFYYRFKSLQPHFVGSTCLELGSADGQMTRRLLEVFQNVTSVEGSPSFCDKLRIDLGEFPSFRIECALFEEYEPDRVFDTIVASHVLEHIKDPVCILKKIKDWLFPDGVLLVLVPNAFSFHRLVAVKMGLLERAEQLNDLDIRLGHRRVYTKAHLVNHLESAGWEICLTGGLLFKALSNQQIEQWFTEQMLDGFYELGKDFPDYAAEIYAVCRLPRS